MHIKLLVLPFQKKCIGHVQKRVSAALRKLKRESPGLGGKGKLTDGTVVKLQSYYGIAIRSNVEFDGNEKSHPSQRTPQRSLASMMLLHIPIWALLLLRFKTFWCSGHTSRKGHSSWMPATGSHTCSPDTEKEPRWHQEKKKSAQRPKKKKRWEKKRCRRSQLYVWTVLDILNLTYCVNIC